MLMWKWSSRIINQGCREFWAKYLEQRVWTRAEREKKASLHFECTLVISDRWENTRNERPNSLSWLTSQCRRRFYINPPELSFFSILNFVYQERPSTNTTRLMNGEFAGPNGCAKASIHRYPLLWRAIGRSTDWSVEAAGEEIDNYEERKKRLSALWY